MSLRERIYRKIQAQMMNNLSTPEKVILGRDEYMEFINTPYEFIPTTFQDPLSIMGLKVKISHRKKYLCVVAKKPKNNSYEIRSCRF
jgi:hypothetical protein